MINLKEIRSNMYVSQIDVARKLKLPISTYNQYETGKNEPNIDMLCKLADYFHVSLDELVGRKSNNINLEALEPKIKTLIQKILDMNKIQQAQTINFVNSLTMFDD